ncbi:hypothetical protein [Streptomyces sp. NPDC050704]|uniref:hypothetical protein n=1 Tax=Streptomyces sp. NPDC050704 TaxID=3157219 RepID=UPI0034223316
MSRSPDAAPGAETAEPEAKRAEPDAMASRPGVTTARLGAKPTRPVRRWPLVLLRVCTCVLLLLTLAQPVLAGMFITGDTDLLDLHALNATLVSTMSWLTVAAAVTLWRPGGGPAWPIGLTLLVAGLVEAQSGFGYARDLALHIPLGVALVAGLTAQTYWVFAHRTGRAKGGNR